MKTNTVSILKGRNLKVTPQRIAVLNALISGGHFTGEQIYNSIRKEVPGVSLSTVYNTLDTLEKERIINSFEVNGMKWYEARTESHVNVYCSDSGEVIDLDVDLSSLFNELKKKGINTGKVSIVVYTSCGPRQA